MELNATLRDRWRRDGDAWHMPMPEGWMQGRSIFGGVTAAAATALAYRHLDDPARSLRTISTQLLAPVVPGPVVGVAKTLRSGKNVTFCEVRLSQGDTEVLVAQLVFARPRDTKLAVAGRPCPETADVDTLADLPYVPGVVPEFTQNAQMRWADGAPPFTRATQARFVARYRYRVPLADAEGALALLDTFPAPSLSMLSAPAPASTVSWTAHLLRTPVQSDGWYTFAYETVAGADGFHTIAGHLWDPDGNLVGYSEQLVVVFA